MARRLKTYTTSAGFFDLAVAAPSMKAALEAWGAGSNLFHQGFARETDNAAIVAATLKKPGVVLRRPVGSKGAFAEDAELPSSLGGATARRGHKRPKPSRARKVPPSRSRRESPTGSRKAEADRAAMADFAREEKRRAAAEARERKALQKARRQRDRAISAAEAALERARDRHAAATRRIEADRAALDRRAAAEQKRWEEEQDKLQATLKRARSSFLKTV